MIYKCTLNGLLTLLNNVKRLTSKNLKECEAMLDFDYFYRCHPSHIVNLHQVVKMRNKDAFLERLETL